MEKLQPVERAVSRAARDPDKPDVRTCEVCGQIFDRRSLEQTYFHSAEPHQPRLFWR